MKISSQQISIFTEDESTSSPEGFRVNLTPTQVSDLEKKMTDTSGLKCLEQFKRFDHVGLWAKTFSDLLIGRTGWYSKRCSLTWRLKGTPYNRMYFLLQVSTPPTEEIESGLLLLKTPTAMDGEVSSGKKNPISGNSGTLAQELMSGYEPTMMKLGLLPTPMAQSRATDKEKTLKRKEVYGGMKRAMYLDNYLALNMLPTPSAGTEKSGGSLTEWGGSGNKMRGIDGASSQLSTRFVMEMMGFPPDWTELPFLNGDKNPSKEEETQ